MDHPLISGVIIQNNDLLTLDEFSRAINIRKELVIEMVEFELIQPEGQKPEEWRFDSQSLTRGQIASRFYRDLEVNWPGIALALDLLNQIDELQRELRIFQKTYK